VEVQLHAYSTSALDEREHYTSAALLLGKELLVLSGLENRSERSGKEKNVLLMQEMET
jgi:hypothetical protein